MASTKKYAFIAHYVEPWNWLLNLRMFGFLHEHPEWRFILFPLYPLCILMSIYYFFRKEPFKVVDFYRVNNGLQGYTILINNFAWHFIFPSYYEKIRQRILAATLYAQNTLEVDVVGLGALTKAETLTEGGLWLTKQTGVNLPIVHGDTCTAWFVIKQLVDLYRESGEEKPIALIGPTSKIGRAIILYLAPRGYVFKAFTDSAKRFTEIQQEIPKEFQANLVHVTDLQQAKDCRVWVTGKYKPSGKRLLSVLPPGATVLNFAVPDPLVPADLGRRKDIRHLDGGLAKTPHGCEMHFAMRLKPGVTYACAAGTMLHAQRAWKNSEVAEVQITALEEMDQACDQLGLTLAPKTSHLKECSS